MGENKITLLRYWVCKKIVLNFNGLINFTLINSDIYNMFFKFFLLSVYTIATLFLTTGCGEIVSSLENSSIKGFDLSFQSLPNITASNVVTYPVSGRCVPQYNDVTVNVGIPSLVSQTFPCVNGLFSGAVDLSTAGLPEGLTSISATQALLTASASIQVLKDTIVPTVPVILNPINGASFNSTPITVSGTCETGTTVSVFGDIEGSTILVSCVAGAFSTPTSLVLGNGAKNISATQTDSVGNTSAADAISVSLGILPLMPTILTPSAGLITSLVAQTISGACESGATVNIFGDVVGAPVTTACVLNTYSLGVTLTALNGLKAINVSQTNGVGTSPTSLLNITLDDVIPSVPTILTPVNNSFTNITSQTVTGACETGATVNLSGDFTGSPLTASCVANAYSRAITLSVAQGSKSISATQTDLAGNTSVTTNINVTLDTIAPSAPTVVTPSNGALTNTTTQTVTGACETGATVNLSGAFTGSPITAACVTNAYSQAITLTAAQGSKSISATQTDLAGNISSATNISVTLDSVDPLAPSITAPANGSFTNTTSQTVNGACETGATVNLSGDFTGSPLTASCVASLYSRAITLTASEGSKAISATQTDLAGNTSLVTNISITLDSTLPGAPTITSPANGSLTNNTSQVVTGACETGAIVSISGDIVTSPQTTTCVASAFSRLVVLSAGDGSKALSAIQTDIAGNISLSTNISFTLDTAAPSAPTILTPVSGAFTNTTAQTVTGACETGSTVNLSGDFVGSPLTELCAAAWYSRAITLTASQGSKSINVTQTDPSGNTSVATNITVTFDAVAPGSPTIATPANGAVTNISAQTVTGACETGATVNLSGDFAGSPLTATCVASLYSRGITLTVAQGSKAISATQTDPSGNTSVATNINITFDSVAPTAPTITTPANGSLTNTTAQTVTGSCESGATVNLTGDFTGSPLTAACVANAYTRAITLAASQGSKAISATQTDLAGNTSLATNITVTLDTTAPSAPTITAPVNGSFTNTIFQSVTGSCESGAIVNVSGDFSESPVIAPCSSSSYTVVNITLISSQGLKSISATQTDPAGNTSSATNISLTLDTIAPSTPTVVAPTNNLTVSSVSQTVSGACETGATVNISGDIVGSPVATTCVASAYSRAITLTAAFGVKVVNVNQIDQALNPSGSVGITINYTNLNVTYPGTFTGPKYTPLNDPSAGVAATVVAGAPTNFSISPSLPAGLTINAGTGLISGTPTVSDDVGQNYTITISDGIGTIQRVMFLRIAIPDYTWLGTAGDGLWTTPSNWRVNAIPPSTAFTYFDDECLVTGNCNVNINANTQVRRVYMKPTYSGTITQNPGVTFQVGLRSSTGSAPNFGKWEMEAGTFQGGNANLTVDRLNIIGGAFTSTSGTLLMGSSFNNSNCETGSPAWDWKNSRECGFTLSATGVFNHNNGTVHINSSTNLNGVRVFAFSVDQQLNLANLIIDNNSNGTGTTFGRKALASTHIYGTNKIINVSTNLDWRDGHFLQGEIRYQGLNANFECDNIAASDRCSDLGSNLNVSAIPGGASIVGIRAHTFLRFNRNDGTPQTYTFDDGAAAPGFIIDNPNGVNQIATNPAVGYFRLGRFRLIQGTFVAPKHLSFGEGSNTSFATESSSIGFEYLGGFFDHNNGLVSFDSVTNSNDNRSAMVIDIDGPGIIFNDFALNIAGDLDLNDGPTGDEYSIKFTSDSIVNIEGDMDIHNGTIKSDFPTFAVFNVYGNINYHCQNPATKDCYGAIRDVDINLVGGADSQLYFEPGGSGYMGSRGVSLRINKNLSTNRVSLIGNGGLASSSTYSPVLNISSGIFDISTYQFRHQHNFVNNGAVQCSVGMGYFQFTGSFSGTPVGGNQPLCYGP